MERSLAREAEGVATQSGRVAACALHALARRSLEKNIEALDYAPRKNGNSK